MLNFAAKVDVTHIEKHLNLPSRPVVVNINGKLDPIHFLNNKRAILLDHSSGFCITTVLRQYYDSITTVLRLYYSYEEVNKT